MYSVVEGRDLQNLMLYNSTAEQWPPNVPFWPFEFFSVASWLAVLAMLWLFVVTSCVVTTSCPAPDTRISHMQLRKWT